MPRFSSDRRTIALTALVSLLAVGCTQTAARRGNAVAAPGLNGEGKAHVRGTSDPNAPFILADRAKSSSTAPFSGAESESPVCNSASLQAYEAGASMNGDSRIVKLAFKNRGTSTCRLSGFPLIVLEDEKGTALASIAIRQTGATSVEGSVATPVQSTAAALPVEVILRPAAAASFEISWVSGDACPLVSRFTVALPARISPQDIETRQAFSGAFTINHPLNICNGEVRVTALTEGGAT